jgi:hypothetical protein
MAATQPYATRCSLELLLMYADKKDLTFEKAVPASMIFFNQHLQQKMKLSSIIYKLPTRPDGVLNLLGCIYKHLCEVIAYSRKKQYIHSLHINLYTSYDRFLNRQNELQSLDIVQYMQEKNFHDKYPHDVIMHFLENIHCHYEISKSVYCNE